MTKSRRFTAGSAFILALWTSTQDVRALSIPEVAGSTYYPCLQSELTPYVMSIAAEYNDCAPRTTYNWDSGFLPTTAQRQEMCACKLLIAKVQTVRAPHCVLYRISLSDGTTNSYSYKNLIEFALGYCSSSSSSTSSSSTSSSTTSTTTRGTTAPTATPTPSEAPSYYDTPYTSAPSYSPYTYAPTYTYSPSFDLDTSNSSSNKKGKSKAGLIIGILVAVGVVSAIAAFVVRKKRNNANRATSGDAFATPGKCSKSTCSHDNSDVEAGGALAALDVQGGDLSPLGVGATATFLEMPPSPSAPAPEPIAVKQQS